MIKRFFISIALGISLFSCSIFRIEEPKVETVDLDEVVVLPSEPLKYQASNTRINDLLHTKIEVKFDWEKAYLHGSATLTLKPYFLPSDSLTLDAKGFKILEVVKLEDKGLEIPLKYTYKNQKKLHIDLAKTYSRNDTYKIFIKYIAKPNELEEGGSAAITSDKGLYFINPQGKEANKPKQIWTQGETEASSCWFPTIDSPNERMTQEIYMTVDTQYVTLSNGLLMFQTENGNGTRTDYWKQKLPHAPYLAMMAVGEFAIVKDHYKDIDVNYYVEPQYKAYAKEIFPHTPEMLAFFSEKLGVPYPWEKYDQIVVRDYVSGAMENTTAVIFGEFAQGDSRYLIDNSAEDVVSHELFHHWFGDLVTCESWSNLPLNESFATYGEYLWREHKDGRMWADYHIYEDLLNYMRESKRKQVDLIRFHYANKEDMFDNHSYAKGGRVLHMLRYYLGDEVFFEGLRTYLEDNKFQSVEIHNLRLAMEKISGQDLNWFFNQWFLSSGHPTLEIESAYDSDLGIVLLTVEQHQNLKNTPLYKLPVAVDIYTESGEVKRHQITVTKEREIFEFKSSSKAVLVNFDAEKMLLCEKNDKKKSNSEWIYLYQHGPLYMDKIEAIIALKDSKDSAAVDMILQSLQDEFWAVRLVGLENLESAVKLQANKVKSQLKSLATTDSNSTVRSYAISYLSEYFPEDKPLENVYESALKDSSYVVLASALESLYMSDPTKGLKVAAPYEKLNNVDVLTTIAGIYANSTDASKLNFYENAMSNLSGFDKYGVLYHYGTYIQLQSENEMQAALATFKNSALNENAWWMRSVAANTIIGMKKISSDRISKINKKADNTTNGNISEENKILKNKNQQLLNDLNAALEEIKEKESNTTIVEEVTKALNK